MKPAPREQLTHILGFAMRPRHIKNGDRLGRTRCLSLSSGALHPISVLLLDQHLKPELLRYNAHDHTIESMNANSDQLSSFRDRAQRLVPDANGHFLVLVADRAAPDAAYINSNSLIWRDAGALLQNLATVCTAYGMAFCPLGLLGNEIIRSFTASDQLIAVGTAVIGIP